jgi:hypothetical protein
MRQATPARIAKATPVIFFISLDSILTAPSEFLPWMDCILTRLWLLTPSSSSDYRSVSDGQPWASNNKRL